MTPYSIVNIKKTASKSNQDLEFDGDCQYVQDDEGEEAEEEDITKDAMIKVRCCIVIFLVFLDLSLLLNSCVFIYLFIYLIHTL
jgi:hypothetical protein